MYKKSIIELIVAAVMILAILTVFIYKKLLKISICILTIFSIFSGYISISEFSKKLQQYDNIQNEIEVTGNINEIEKGEYSYKIDITSGRIHYYVYTKQEEEVNTLKLGNTIIVTGNLIAMETSRNYGNFNEKDYLRSMAVAAKLDCKSIEVIDNSQNEIKIYLKSIRDKLCSTIDEITDEKSGGILKAMLFGNREGIDEETKEMYQDAGILHLISISGLHIGAVGNVLFNILRRRLGYYSSSVISGTVMVMFGILTGGSVSAIRAVIMFMISTAAKVLGRKYDIKSAISLTVLLMLLYNPYFIYNVSFKLSVMAIVAIAFIYEELYRFVFKYREEKSNGRVEKAINNVISSFLVSISVTIATAPIIADTYFEISLYSIAVNLVVIPLMSLVLSTGLLSVFVSVISIKLGSFFIGLDMTVLKFYEFICKLVNKLPFNKIALKKPEDKAIILYYIVLCIVVGIVYAWNNGYKIITILNKKIMMSAVGFGFLILGAVLLRKDTSLITFIDVGQGDCAFINVEGVRILVDGGSSDISKVGKYRIAPTIRAYGYDTVDIVFVSHTDKDHISGIEEIISDRLLNIKMVVLPDALIDDESYYSFIRMLEEENIAYSRLKTGDNVQLGNAYFSILSPDESTLGDINDKSLVMLMEYNDFTCLFTGDISKAIEEGLLQNYKSKLENLDVLKVAHHGSNTASSEAFIENMQPEAGIISCGIMNSYGHPHKETLELLMETGVKVFRTDESGAIQVKLEGGEIMFSEQVSAE